MNFVETIFQILVLLAIFLARAILLPIDFLISTLLPSLSSAFTAVGAYLSEIMTYIGFVLSITGIPPAIITLVVAFWVFKLTVPINVWIIKLAVSWYHKLK